MSRAFLPSPVFHTVAFMAALVAASVAPLGALQQEDPEEQEPAFDRWTPALSMLYDGISGTALSPDGSLVAYVVRTALTEGEKSEYLSHVWIASTDGARKAQYTRGDNSASSPSFSPNGDYLAFTTGRSGRNQVWVIPLDGGEAFRVTDAKTGVGGYSWSPDGLLDAGPGHGGGGEAG